jgi:hypothetical protein
MTQELPHGQDLWERYFEVKYNYFKSRSINHIRKFGVRVSGVAEIDAQLENYEVVTQANINTMFEKWRSGVSVRVLKYSDTAEIYRIIHHHLITWAEYLSTGVNIGDAPLKDLVELDRFAEIVYDKARAVFTENQRATAISKNFLDIQEFNFENILRPAGGIRLKSGGVVTDVVKDRASLKEVFTTEMDQLSTWRGTED